MGSPCRRERDRGRHRSIPLLFRSPKRFSCLYIFFTSRRRNTRFKCDWSSDVCSSDLKEIADRLFHEWFVKFRFPGHTTTTFVETAKARTPAEWSRRTLSDLIELRYGKALKADQRVPGPFPVYGSSGVVGWHNNYLVEGPGIVVGRKGNVGSVHWSREAFYPIDTVFYVSTSWPKTFVFHVLQSQQFLNSDSAVPGLNRDQALRSSINLPPIALAIEFHRHANEYFQFMAKLGDINKNLRAARDLLLPRLISGEIDLAASDPVVERISGS